MCDDLRRAGAIQARTAERLIDACHGVDGDTGRRIAPAVTRAPAVLLGILPRIRRLQRHSRQWLGRWSHCHLSMDAERGAPTFTIGHLKYSIYLYIFIHLFTYIYLSMYTYIYLYKIYYTYSINIIVIITYIYYTLQHIILYIFI